jgi:hypothetical protein
MFAMSVLVWVNYDLHPRHGRAMIAAVVIIATVTAAKHRFWG